MMVNIEKTIQALAAIRDMGVQVALDDFGTSYSSLNYLKQFPLDVLKIDRTFTKGMMEHPADAEIAKMITQLGHRLGLSIVAEGVEKTEQLEMYKRWGCEEVQGFLFGAPQPAARIIQKINHHVYTDSSFATSRM